MKNAKKDDYLYRLPRQPAHPRILLQPVQDGKYFEKSEEISRRFSQTGAYDELFLELLDPDKCALFINGILPQDALARANAMKEAPNPADLTVAK